MILKTYKNILITLLLFLLTSCGLVYQVLLGVDSTPDWNLDKAISNQAKKYNIPNDDIWILDTSHYFNGLRKIYKEQIEALNIVDKDSTEYYILKNALKDDSQPVQFRLFDSTGVEIFKMVNCYVDPPIPMNWNVDNCFDTFPPKTTIKSLNVHSFGLDFLLSNTKSLNGNQITFDKLPKNKYYGVITWNDFFKRPSKNLIKTVEEKIIKNNYPVTMLYINNHNSYLWLMMDSEDKEKVKKHLEANN